VLILTAVLIAEAAIRGGLVLVDAVVDDLQDLDGTEHGAETADGRELVGVDLCHAAHDADSSSEGRGRMDPARWWWLARRRRLLEQRSLLGWFRLDLRRLRLDDGQDLDGAERLLQNP
jgi:hypothetical protein